MNARRREFLAAGAATVAALGVVSPAAAQLFPAVRDAIAKARPLLVGFGERFVTTPVGGHRPPQPARP